MAYTYNPNDPFATDKDKVRLLIGDTDTDEQLLQDGEILAFLSEEADPYLAAAECCRSIAGIFSKRADSTIADTKFEFVARAKKFLDLADRLGARGSSKSSEVMIGGVDVGQSAADAANTGIRQPSLPLKIMDYGTQR